MTDDVIPGDLRDFILRHIDSVAQLEALLLLRANPNEGWDIEQTAARLYVEQGEVAEALARLCADGLLRLVLALDKLVFTLVDLTIWRTLIALLSTMIISYGLIWDTE